MKITICGSMSFAKNMLETKKELETEGHEVVVPKELEIHIDGKIQERDKWEKINFNVFKKYFNEIKNCDAILVINKAKNDIENYVGANSLIEMAFAHVLDRKIFLLNDVPKMNCENEILAMQPIVLNRDFKKIN